MRVRSKVYNLLTRRAAGFIYGRTVAHEAREVRDDVLTRRNRAGTATPAFSG